METIKPHCQSSFAPASGSTWSHIPLSLLHAEYLCDGRTAPETQRGGGGGEGPAGEDLQPRQGAEKGVGGDAETLAGDAGSPWRRQLQTTTTVSLVSFYNAPIFNSFGLGYLSQRALSQCPSKRVPFPYNPPQPVRLSRRRRQMIRCANNCLVCLFTPVRLGTKSVVKQKCFLTYL